MKKNHIVIIAIIVMGLIFALAAYFYNAQQIKNKNQLAQQHANALIPAHAIKKGDPNAKVTIVEFLDPACHTCKLFHPVIKDLLQKYPTKINYVVRYAPLHPGSDQMIAILEAARKQEQFWNVLELMFESQQYWTINHVAKPELFWGILKGYGFDIERIDQDMRDPAIAKIIQQDLADGQRLGATKTPTFFVNGKPLPSFGYQQLMNLVQSELAANY
jgi:protein-disulfide isomerase